MGLVVSLILMLIWHTKQAYKHILCQYIDIQIQEPFQQAFITKEQVWQCLDKQHKLSSFIGKPTQTINIKDLIHQLKTLPMIKNVIITKTWHGSLKIHLQTKYVLARILSKPTQRYYIDEDGYVVSTNQYPLHSLLILDGINPQITKNIKNDYPNLWQILQYLHKDKFWRYQITSLQLLKNQKIILGTQIGNHQIEFGKAEQIVPKFNKLHWFYNYIIPYKGWHAYHLINLEFNHQIICT